MLLKKIENIYVNQVLVSIENLSKLFLLSTFAVRSDFSSTRRHRIISLWNLWTICGLLVYSYVHISHVSQTDLNQSDRTKWVTVAIDSYNKLIGVVLISILVTLTFVRQQQIADINRIFCEIDDIVRSRMGIDINNWKTQR